MQQHKEPKREIGVAPTDNYLIDCLPLEVRLRRLQINALVQC
jgi:hypothetical protein